MNVYRVETEDGTGAFKSDIVSEAAREVRPQPTSEGDYPCWPEDPYRHPGPSDDVLLRARWDSLKRPREYYFGFESIDSLLSWFDSEALRRAMNKRGLAVSVYWVPTLAERCIGCRQVIFKRGSKKPRKRFPLPTLEA